MVWSLRQRERKHPAGMRRRETTGCRRLRARQRMNSGHRRGCEALLAVRRRQQAARRARPEAGTVRSGPTASLQHPPHPRHPPCGRHPHGPRRAVRNPGRRWEPQPSQNPCGRTSRPPQNPRWQPQNRHLRHWNRCLSGCRRAAPQARSGALRARSPQPGPGRSLRQPVTSVARGRPWSPGPKPRPPKVDSTPLPRHLLRSHRLPRHRLPRHRLPRHRLPRHLLRSHRLSRHRLPRCRLPRCRLPRCRLPRCRKEALRLSARSLGCPLAVRLRPTSAGHPRRARPHRRLDTRRVRHSHRRHPWISRMSPRI
jgi:hypothetical protein